MTFETSRVQVIPLVNLLGRSGRWDVALAVCNTLIASPHTDKDARDEAHAALEFCHWMMGQKKNALALHMENRSNGRQSAAIAAQFAYWAPDYDVRVRSKSEYRGAELVANALLKSAGRVLGATLDVGCGTGFLGEQLKGQAGPLTGIDASRDMLSQAERKGIYAELIEGDAVEFLSKDARMWDAIAASSVLQFIPNLEEFFMLSAARLAPAGVFAATIDRAEDLGVTSDIVSVGWGVFAHTRSYLERSAERAGLRLASYEATWERKSVSAHVDSAVIVLMR